MRIAFPSRRESHLDHLTGSGVHAAWRYLPEAFPRPFFRGLLGMSLLFVVADWGPTGGRLGGGGYPGGCLKYGQHLPPGPTPTITESEVFCRQ